MGAESTCKTTPISEDWNGKYETQVVLNVYDLTPANNYSYWFGFGIFHSGIEGDFSIFLWSLHFGYHSDFCLVFCAPFVFVKMPLKKVCWNRSFSIGILLSIWFRMELNWNFSMGIREMELMPLLLINDLNWN